MIANCTITNVPADRVSPAAKAHTAASAQRSSRAQTMHHTIKATAKASVYPAKKKKLAGHTAASITVRSGCAFGTSYHASRSSPQKSKNAGTVEISKGDAIRTASD